ncbi:outer membrane porin, OprD family [Pseudomonas sp. GM79]|uniref:OprD family porin n=1 Tax=Pseudomonas sp. GM79 TaxID=1144338 RepID=UPI00026F47EB|nr:OprD family porin [Pseudomonas sp. GM79]EJN17907.1 outer membrane porin, OprD family [Pseudomonas sp. GM79]
MVLNSKALHVTGALLVSTMLLQPSSFAQGLVEDSTANLTLRNFFFERTFTAPNYPQDKAREWTQSFIFDLRSGFTSGTIGVGVDVLGKYAVKLDGGAGRYGALLLPKDRDGEPADNFGRLGVALKARLGATELKVGEWMPNLPIVTADDFRALPQTFEGAQLSSQDIKHWTLYAGQLNKSSLRNDSSMEDLAFGSAHSDAFNYLGGDYRSESKNTTIRLWSGQLEDIYQQQYVGLNQRWQLSTSATLNTNIGYFWGKDDGSAKAGRLDNRTASLMIGLGVYEHTFSIGLQQVSGDTGWMRISGTGGIYLANNTFNHAFDNPREKSWQLRYDLNFAGYGLPGLSLMTRYVRGEDVRLQKIDNGSEWVRETELGYVIQSGPAKNLAVRWRNASVRRDFNNSDYDENRVILTYPINIL